MHFRSHKDGGSWKCRGSEEEENETSSLIKGTNYSCVHVYGAKASESWISFFDKYGLWLHPHRQCTGIVNSRWIKHIAYTLIDRFAVSLCCCCSYISVCINMSRCSMHASAIHSLHCAIILMFFVSCAAHPKRFSLYNFMYGMIMSYPICNSLMFTSPYPHFLNWNIFTASVQCVYHVHV